MLMSDCPPGSCVNCNYTSQLFLLCYCTEVAFLLYSGVVGQKTIVPCGLINELGTMVEVLVAKGHPTFGVIRWIDYLSCVKDKLIGGLELVRKDIL